MGRIVPTSIEVSICHRSLISPLAFLIAFHPFQALASEAVLGSKVKIWKQDPTVEPIGLRTAYIHTPVENGPKDADIEIKGMPVTLANADNDYLFDPEENQSEFDSGHTFTVVRQIQTMYQRALKRNENAEDFNWQ